MKFGERDMDGSLEWDKVAKANYQEVNSYTNFSDVVNNSKERIIQNSAFKLINDYAKWLKNGQDDTMYSLNYKQFKKDTKNHQKSGEKFKSVYKFDSNLKFVSPKSELSLIKTAVVDGDKRMAWHKNLAKDIYISEALNVLSELKMKNLNQIIKN